jgi:succinoglycan biosynthesis protein ExoM
VEQGAAIGGSEIIVVDNSPDGRQHKVLAPLLSGAEAIRYLPEPRAGLVYARNAGATAARGTFIVFLDDDQEAHGGWLAALSEALETTGADAAFGPVIAAFEQAPDRLADFAARLYTRDLQAARHADVSRLFNYLGTGNSAFRTATCFAGNPAPFDPRFNKTGGEDTDFLRRLAFAGRKFVWAPDAIVDEQVPASRATAETMAARRFAQGQMRTFSHLASDPKRLDKAAFWMMAGAAQYAGHSAAAAADALLGKREGLAIHRIQAQGGLGKVLWQARFRKTRYGEPQ